ncbi:recombinase family protein [Clostridium rectalis]|uniref:recombinase family protein n=1 Tax=Clostridium rectalis TaxID=2040295 RepID=UPI000F63925B|nr:recombinase family protein [Clostridium rectalis]
MGKVWNVAIYARVSTDKKEQQESIPVQVEGLESWLLKKSREDTKATYNLIQVYKDEGFSGSNFKRDSFLKMKHDIDNGKINMVLTRDLSRFGRNYIISGYYIEDYFKAKNIRFISVLDNVDTLYDTDDIIPFKNILNEMYIKDCSKRTRDALKQRMIRGSSIASKPPYGYKTTESYEGQSKIKKLVLANDETTEVVKKIYDLYLQGWGFGKIATYLNKKGMLPPSARLNNFSKRKKGTWTNNTIKSILTNPKYAGLMVQGQYKRVSYKVKKVIKVNKEEWIYGGDFKGIIDRNTFKKVQDEIKRRSKGYRYKGGKDHIFSTVLKCNECSGSMCYKKQYNGYKCTKSQTGGGKCTSHSVKEEYLKEIIINNLEKVIIKNEIDTDKIYMKIKNVLSKDYEYMGEIYKIDREMNILNRQYEKMYIDKLKEVISDSNFYNISICMKKKKEALLKRKEQLIRLNNLYSNHDNLHKVYCSKIDNLLSFKEFDKIIVEALIDKIVVSENKYTKDKNIDIYYKFHI